MMSTSITTLVVSDGIPAADSLHTALRQAGLKAWQVRPSALLAGLYLDLPPDLILVSAEVGTECLQDIRRVLDGGAAAATLLVFGEHDADDLGQHLAAGFDYLVPPFVPELLSHRLSICLQHRSLSDALERLSDSASLLKYERELQIGREIQHGFLPANLPVREGWDLGVRFNPAREVAGDFYDGFELANGRRVGVVIADVCDKGVGAALFMALIRTLIRHTATRHSLPPANELQAGQAAGLVIGQQGGAPWAAAAEGRMMSDLLLAASAGTLLSAVTGTDTYMTENHLSQGYFATVFFGILDPATGHFLYINGGHNPPVLVGSDGRRRLLEPTGPAVGILPNSRFEVGEVVFERGDALFLYTDGVTEARSPSGEFFGEQRMYGVLDEQTITGSAALLDRMDAALVRHVGTADQFDDITMMALLRTCN